MVQDFEKLGGNDFGVCFEKGACPHHDDAGTLALQQPLTANITPHPVPVAPLASLSG